MTYTRVLRATIIITIIAYIAYLKLLAGIYKFLAGKWPSLRLLLLLLVLWAYQVNAWWFPGNQHPSYHIINYIFLECHCKWSNPTSIWVFYSPAICPGHLMHIESICTKARQILGLLYRRFYYSTDPSMIKQLYLSMVRPLTHHETKSNKFTDHILLSKVRHLSRQMLCIWLY